MTGSGFVSTATIERKKSFQLERLKEMKNDTVCPYCSEPMNEDNDHEECFYLLESLISDKGTVGSLVVFGAMDGVFEVLDVVIHEGNFMVQVANIETGESVRGFPFDMIPKNNEEITISEAREAYEFWTEEQEMPSYRYAGEVVAALTKSSKYCGKIEAAIVVSDFIKANEIACFYSFSKPERDKIRKVIIGVAKDLALMNIQEDD